MTIFNFFDVVSVDCDESCQFAEAFLIKQFSDFKSNDQSVRNEVTVNICSSRPSSSFSGLLTWSSWGSCLKLYRSSCDKYAMFISGCPPKALMSRVLLFIFRVAFSRSHFSICHAAVVGKKGGCELLFGPGGAGKTETAFLRASVDPDLSIFTDDYCFVGMDHSVLPVPRYVVIKPDNFKYVLNSLSEAQINKFERWELGRWRSFIRLLPGRFRQSPIVHLENDFILEADRLSVLTIHKITTLEPIEDEHRSSYFYEINQAEFAVPQNVRFRGHNTRVSFSEDFNVLNRKLQELEHKFWTDFFGRREHLA